MTSYINALRNYAVFSGRTTRSDFWPFILVNAFITLMLNGGMWYTSEHLRRDPNSLRLLLMQAGIVLMGVPFLLSVLIPTIAVTVRRLHDTGKTGWCLLITFVPFVGGIVLCVLCALKGDAGANRFGPSVSSPDGAALPNSTVELPVRR